MYKKKKKLDNSVFVTVMLAFSFILFASYLLYLFNLNFASEKEILFTQISREMNANKSYLIPMHLNRPFWNHLFLYHLIQILPVKLLGLNMFIFRIPSLVFSLLLMISSLYFLSRVFNPIVGILSTFILIATPVYFHASHLATQDIFITFCSSMVMFSFLSAYDELSRSAKFHNQQVRKFSSSYLLGFLYLTLGYLALGVKFICLVGVVVLPFYWWRMKLDFLYKNHSFIFGLSCLALIFIISNAFLFKVYGLGVMLTYLKTQLSQDMSWSSNYNSILVFLIGYLPWVFFIPQALFSAIFNELNYSEVKYERFVVLFSLWWIISLMVLGAVLKLNQEFILLQTSVPFATLIGLWLYGIVSSKVDSIGLYLGIGAIFVFCIAILAYSFLSTGSNLIIIGKYIGLFEAIFLFVFFVGIAMSISSYMYHSSTALYFYLAVVVVSMLSYSGYFMPKFIKSGLMTNKEEVNSVQKKGVEV